MIQILLFWQTNGIKCVQLHNVNDQLIRYRYVSFFFFSGHHMLKLNSHTYNIITISQIKLNVIQPVIILRNCINTIKTIRALLSCILIQICGHDVCIHTRINCCNSHAILQHNPAHCTSTVFTFEEANEAITLYLFEKAVDTSGETWYNVQETFFVENLSMTWRASFAYPSR